MKANYKIYDPESGWEWETSSTDIKEALESVIYERYYDQVNYFNNDFIDYDGIEFVKDLTNKYGFIGHPLHTYVVTRNGKRDGSHGYLEFMAYTGKLSNKNKSLVECTVCF
jgi:hypothetical protein